MAQWWSEDSVMVWLCKLVGVLEEQIGDGATMTFTSTGILMIR